MKNTNNENRANIVDICFDENNAVLLYGASREKAPLLIYYEDTIVDSYKWFDGNGFILRLSKKAIHENKGGDISLKWSYETEKLHFNLHDIFAFDAINSNVRWKRYMGKGIFYLKNVGLIKTVETVCSYLTSKMGNIDYNKWLQRQKLRSTKSVKDVAVRNYSLFNYTNNDRVYAFFEKKINLYIDEWKNSTLKMPSVIYFDEDEFFYDEKNQIKFHNPIFKPDFDKYLLENDRYLKSLILISESKIDEFKRDPYSFFLHQGKKDSILHIPEVVFHRYSDSNISTREQITEKQVTAQVENFLSADIKAMVSILIPNKDHIKDLDRCIKSLINRSSYDNFEIIIIENNSEKKETFDYYDKIGKYPFVKVINYKGKFNYSAINNKGVKAANGEYLLLLNNDTEIIKSDSISELLKIAQCDDVGAVGAKLLYPNNTIQHAGVYIGVNGIADHVWKGYPSNAFVNMNLLNITHQVSAITGACLMVKKSLFDKFGGLNENLEVAFNDIDFCLRLQEAGYKNIYTPGAVLTHYESVSRGADLTPEKWRRFRRETGYMRARWNRILTEGDPFYNSNLTCIGTEGTLKKRCED